MRKIVLLMKAVTLLLFMFSSPSHAQSQTVSGSVQDSDKKTPLAGVTIKVNGTNTVTSTDEKGNFTIKASSGQTLIITHIGFETQRVSVSGGKISISLKTQSAELADVIVVAMDQKRKPRELGYSVQKVSGKEIADTKRENFLNSLQGRVAGLTITPTNGMAGASSQIVLRGFNSLTLSNQPLFVVDGVIVDNSTMDETSNGGSQLGLASDRPNRNNDYTNRIADINPNDIESITVLKGPEATALYGSQASSGAIVITTKKTRSTEGNKLNVSYDNAFRIQEITNFPQVNNDYAPGTNGTPTTNSFTYFGPAYPSGTPSFDNIHSFFRTGFTQTHNLGLDFGNKISSFRVSGAYLDQKGVIPRNAYTKTNFRIANTTKIGKRIEITPTLSYTHSVNEKPLRGAGGYYLDLLAWPINYDINNYLDANGNRKQIYVAGSIGEGTDNPLFNAMFNHASETVSRWIGTMGINVNLLPWLTASGRFGYDTYKTEGYEFITPQSSLSSTSIKGTLDNYWRTYKGYNHTITLNANKKFNDFSVRAVVGNVWQDYQTDMFASYGTGLVNMASDGSMSKNGVPVNNNNLVDALGGNLMDSLLTTQNTRVRLNRNIYGQPNQYITRLSAFFGEVSVGFKDVVYLTYSHRFEGASVFPTKNRNYNYPAGSLSIILSDIFPQIKSGGVINYAKLRTSLAGTARLPEPYLNQSVFGANYASSNIPAYSYGFYNNNENLEPERQKTYEIGAEIKLFNSRISIDGAYYNTLASKQIVQGFRASYATGFILNTMNASTTRNQGFELSVDVAAVRHKDFDWNIRFNFNHMWSKVLELPASIAGEFYIADTWLYGNARGGLYRNNSTGTITGYGYARNAAGQVLINPANGLPVVDANFLVRGDRTPAFTLGTINTMRYKNWNLSFLWDLKVGGDIFNGTEEFLTYSGKAGRTADRMTPRVVTGVLNDGLQNTANPTKNTIAITPYYLSSYYTSMPEEEFIQKNVNWLRLRDITLSYTFNNIGQKIKGLKSLGVFVTGSDLILITNYKGADPATNGNTGLSKGVGGMGFDYGNLPTPRGLNFGLRANF
jgi:TonB-linked SusC/RagA family outer membrane protein